MIPQVGRLLAGVSALLIAITGLYLAVTGGGSDPAPAVIIIRGSTLPVDDTLTDSERDREWLREHQAQVEAVGGNGR